MVIAAMSLEKFFKGNESLASLAWSGEDDRPGFPIHIHENGDIIMPSFGSGFIHSNATKRRKIQLCHGFSHIKGKNAPDTVVRHASNFSDLGNRHFTTKDKQYLFKQEGKATSFPCPWDIDPVDAMFTAFNSWHIGGDDAPVLEEVEMLPAKLLEIVSLAQGTANRTMVYSPSASRQLKPQAAFGKDAVADLCPGISWLEFAGQVTEISHKLPCILPGHGLDWPYD